MIRAEEHSYFYRDINKISKKKQYKRYDRQNRIKLLSDKRPDKLYDNKI